jgi:hypothetical protein
MEHYSFQGPYAYRWVDDVPVERIHLRDGERRVIRIAERRFTAQSDPPAAPACTEPVMSLVGLRALMAAWN